MSRRSHSSLHTGRITQEFQDALHEHGLEAFMGNDASKQPGALSEMLLHETAVAWIRAGLARSLPQRPWEESRAAFGERLHVVVRNINARYDVCALCRAFPARVQLLVEMEGGKIAR